MAYPLWGEAFRRKFALIFNRKPLINYFTMLVNGVGFVADLIEMLLSI